MIDGSPTARFVGELHGEILRRKMVLPKRKVQRLNVPTLMPGQLRLKAVRVSDAMLAREAIYAKNVALAEEQARIDVEAHNRRRGLA